MGTGEIRLFACGFGVSCDFRVSGMGLVLSWVDSLPLSPSVSGWSGVWMFPLTSCRV